MTSGKRVFLAKETMSFEFSIQVPYDMVHVFIFTQSYRNTIAYEVCICLAYFFYRVYALFKKVTMPYDQNKGKQCMYLQSRSFALFIYTESFLEHNTLHCFKC